MRRPLNKILFITIIIFGVYIFSNNILAIDSTRIEIIPESPKPETKIEIKAYTDIDGIEQIYLEIQECDINSGICYERQNISMSKIDDTSYKTSYNLKEAKATYIQYNLLVKTDSGWETLIEKEKTNLLISQNNGKNGNGNQNTPGFEIIGIFIGILSVILLNKMRKR